MELQREDLEKLYAGTFRGLQEGAIIKGKVVKVKPDGIIVDIGTKCEGMIPAVELTEEDLNSFKQGDEIEVYVTDARHYDDFIRLSKEKATRIKTWEILEDACTSSRPVNGKIVGKVKGGMTVEIDGVKAFLPGSQIDLKSLKDTDQLIGQTCAFKVIKVNNKRSNVIVSRRLILEEQRGQLKKETLTKIKEGALVTGIVKNLTDYGAFIDLGGVDGLLHISDMSWGRVSHPGELFRIGDVIEVLVLKFDRETEKVTLGFKQKKPDPWTNVESKYPAGKKITGKIINIMDYGIFIEIEEGLEGLIHVTEFDWLEKIKKPSKYFSIGDTVEAVILTTNIADKRISLSIKQLKPNPWEAIKQKYAVGQRVTGIVRSFTDFGAFISLDEGIDALLHISDMSWTKHINHPSDVFKKGQKIEVAILNIDAEKERISVGLKELTTDPWLEEIPDRYKLGEQVKGKVVKISDFGLFVELEGGIEGLVYSSEVEKPQAALLDEAFKVGMEITARIIKLDTSARKIGLSMKPGLSADNQTPESET